MKTNTAKKILVAGSLAGLAAQSYGVIEMDVAAVVPPTVGTPSSNVPATVGDFGSFELNLFNTTTSVSSTAYLRVELMASSGVTDHHISTGQSGNTDRVGIAILGSTTREATYEFTFWDDAGFTSALVLESFVMQVNDIDLVETVSVEDNKFTGATLASPTDLAVTNPPGDILVSNSVGENINKDNVEAAVNFESVSNISSFEVVLTGEGNIGREFQFDFTPDLILVPEPSSYAILFGVGALALVTLRRRR